MVLDIMIPFSTNHDYNKMWELQEKLRKSEEERIRLEERFNILEQESRLKHETCINKLRMRYIEFLEEQRVRDERNHKLLSALDHVDENLALMNAKADRLCTLRREYEASLMRAYGNRRQGGSVTGDSGIVSQNEDRQLKKDLRNPSYIMPRSRYDIERRIHTSPVASDILENSSNHTSTPRSIFNHASSLHLASKLHGNYNEDRFLQNEQVQGTNSERDKTFQLFSREPKSHTWTGKDDTNNPDSILKRIGHNDLLSREVLSYQYPKYFENATKPSKLTTNTLNTLLKAKQERVSSVLESELDRYIHKIRNLHENNDPHSLEEVEQNTSGDLLNVTLSDDGLDHLPIEGKVREHEIPTEVETILAIADDLVAKTAGDIHVNDNKSHVVLSQNAEDVFTNVGQNLQNESTVDNRVALDDVTVSDPNIHLASSTSASVLAAEDKINDDVAIHTTELNPTAKSIEAITKPADLNDILQCDSVEFQRNDIEIQNDKENLSNTSNHLEIEHSQELCNENQEFENDLNLKIANTLKSSKKENLVTDNQEISQNENSNLSDKSLHVEVEVPTHNVEEENFTGKIDDVENIQNNEINIETELIKDNNINSNTNDDVDIQNNQNLGYKISEQNYEIQHAQQCEQPYEQKSQMYPQDSNQMYEYNNEQYHHDSNQQYQYDSNLQYEQNSNEQYQYNEQNSQYIDDPNAQYQNEQYIVSDNHQYTMNPEEQYHEYTGDPNHQYQAEGYVHDANSPYDSNAIYSYSADNENYMAENAHGESQAFDANQHQQEYQEQPDNNEFHPDTIEKTMPNNEANDLSNRESDNIEEQHEHELSEKKALLEDKHTTKNAKNVIKYILDSDTESTMEKNISNAESDFDFN